MIVLLAILGPLVGFGCMLLTRACTAGRAVAVGPYRLELALGAGGMGAVYRARNTQSGGHRAVKLLPHGASALDQRRFEQEGALGAELCHPNLAAVYERGVGTDG